MGFKIFSLLTFGLAFTSSLVHSAPATFPGEADLVSSLPGLAFKPTFKHYSGYLEAQNGVFLHYWFVESQSANPLADPVALWLNGGPGCSSMMGTLTELGPFRMLRNGTLVNNPHAWNQKVNFLFLESPAGVGFSYKADGVYKQDDTSTSLQNLNALKSFFAKFPHLSDNDFYVTGESYAGIYIPTLSVQLLEHKFPKNFKGVAIGNAFLDETLNANSAVQYVYAHGLVDATFFTAFLRECCPNSTAVDLRHCNFTQNAACSAKADALVFPNKPIINAYNIYGECLHDSPKPVQSPAGTISQYEAVTSLLRRSINSKANASHPTHSLPCMSQDYVTHWFNQPQVRAALHITEKSLAWGPCRSNIGYHANLRSMKSQVKHMVDSGLKVLIYNGDVDMVCNFLGDQWFVEELGYNVVHPYAPWMLNGQVGGFSKVYEHQLTFTTVRGAGHMVPDDKPVEALHMFSQFIGM